MFPSNLHKNIVQLDRQISLLENECKNMEIDKRKRRFRSSEPSFNKTSKITSVHSKASPIKMNLKNTDFKSNKKFIPPVSGRLQSTSTLHSPSSQPWSDNYENVPEGTTKLRKINSNVPSCTCLKSSVTQRKKNKCQNCDSRDGSKFNSNKSDHGENCKHDQILHKELLFSNAGGTIELTVTQKSNSGQEISPARGTILEDKTQKDGICKCQTKGQKWSEILCLDSTKKESASKGNKLKTKFSDETKTVCQPFAYNKNNGYDCRRSLDNINNSNSIIPTIQKENFEVPVKLISPSFKIKNQGKAINKKVEKEIQCVSENTQNTEKDSKIPIEVIQQLVNQLKQMPINEVKESFKNLETGTKIKSPIMESPKRIMSESKEKFLIGDICQNNLSELKQQCDNLIKDKESLSKELSARDNIIATMNKREEEYLSLISNLKLNLEKSKESALESVEAIKKMTNFKNKLLEKIKFSETVQKNFEKAHDLLEKYILENQKLKTQIKILLLEAKKHEVLLAGKDAEISKYKEEIQNFQRQISDHLAVLKSNAQGVDVEKMMEAIFQQSQIFAQTDVESVAGGENDERDMSKTQNPLMHSSPTSTKSSLLNSSWKQISSIHDNDDLNGTGELNLNEDNGGKDFFQIFGDNLSSKSSKKSKQTLVEVPENGGGDLKRRLSFTSCLSLNEDDRESSSRNSSSSNDETISNEEKAVTESEQTNRLSFEKAQSNIDEVLKNMKLKFSKKIFETSLANCTTDDFPDSQISTISQ